MKLVIVESPAKAKTIERYLGKEYTVEASFGHVRDLPKKDLSIDIEHKYEPHYILLKGRGKVLKQLRSDAQKASSIYLALDPDREGEAIGWHIAHVLHLLNKNGTLEKSKASRIVFHEITQEAVQQAIKNPRDIDIHLVDAQKARRVLDRLVGYTLSPLLWTKIKYGLSAGRVQSVALKLIVDREKERDNFVPTEYWSISAACSKEKGEMKIVEIKKEKESENENELISVPEHCSKFDLKLYREEKYEPKTQEEANRVVKECSRGKWIITSVKSKEVMRSPAPPFITSTLQRTASTYLGYSASRTMKIAQGLYERGLITYMRTDSFNIAKEAIQSVRKFIVSQYGDEYCSKDIRLYKTKSKLAQEAHEAIRPTHFDKLPHELSLSGEELKLYEMIWKRAVATQMTNARLSEKKVSLTVGEYTFITEGISIIFPGFMKVTGEIKVRSIEDFEEGSLVYPHIVWEIQKFTQPPARYSEATLIKKLEEYGIGRPSTYAAIMSTIVLRGYVYKEKKYLIPTDIGKVVSDVLSKHFPQIMDVHFTAGMEDKLDQVAQGEEEYLKVMEEFYPPFKKLVDKKQKELKKSDIVNLGSTDKKCPLCKGEMIIRLGRFGKFYSCKSFPTCKGMLPFEQKIVIDSESENFKSKYLGAPTAKDGKKMVLQNGKFGMYWAHPEYPKVKESAPLLLLEKCPECGKNLVERKGKWGRTFIGCSGYPNCRYIKKNAPKKIKKTLP
jgi:DNA topoisomerase-1